MAVMARTEDTGEVNGLTRHNLKYFNGANPRERVRRTGNPTSSLSPSFHTYRAAMATTGRLPRPGQKPQGVQTRKQTKRQQAKILRDLNASQKWELEYERLYDEEQENPSGVEVKIHMEDDDEDIPPPPVQKAKKLQPPKVQSPKVQRPKVQRPKVQRPKVQTRKQTKRQQAKILRELDESQRLELEYERLYEEEQDGPQVVMQGIQDDDEEDIIQDDDEEEDEEWNPDEGSASSDPSAPSDEGGDNLDDGGDSSDDGGGKVPPPRNGHAVSANAARLPSSRAASGRTGPRSRSEPRFPAGFPAYHGTQNMNEIAAYLANASYVAAIGGPPQAHLTYGIIIVPVGEETLLFS